MTSENDHPYWLGMGFLFGMISALQLVAIAGTEQPSEWLERYQSLIGALVAVIAAIVTVAGTMWTYKARRAERQRAARAMLPFALVELSSYSKDVIDKLVRVLPPDDKDNFDYEVVTGLVEPTALPREAFVAIQGLIEVSPIAVARELSVIVARSQIFHSRLEELSSDPSRRWSSYVTADAVRGRIVDHLELRARVSRCWDYGRFDRNDIKTAPVAMGELVSAAHSCKIFDEYEVLWTKMRERADHLAREA